MDTYIAERTLLFSEKNNHTRKTIVFRVSIPRVLEQQSVKFPVDGVMACCHVEIEGLNEHSFDVYGMDSMQAVNMASNIEPVLERLSSKYDFFWSSGEPYFE